MHFSFKHFSVWKKKMKERNAAKYGFLFYNNKNFISMINIKVHVRCILSFNGKNWDNDAYYYYIKIHVCIQFIG